MKPCKNPKLCGVSQHRESTVAPRCYVTGTPTLGIKKPPTLDANRPMAAQKAFNALREISGETQTNYDKKGYGYRHQALLEEVVRKASGVVQAQRSLDHVRDELSVQDVQPTDPHLAVMVTQCKEEDFTNCSTLEESMSMLDRLDGMHREVNGAYSALAAKLEDEGLYAPEVPEAKVLRDAAEILWFSKRVLHNRIVYAEKLSDYNKKEDRSPEADDIVAKTDSIVRKFL